MAVPMERTRDWSEDRRNQGTHVTARETRQRREEAGPRNVVDPEAVIEGLAHLLRVWELNRQHRLPRAPFRRDVPRRDRLRGLFGGG